MVSLQIIGNSLDSPLSFLMDNSDSVILFIVIISSSCQCFIMHDPPNGVFQLVEGNRYFLLYRYRYSFDLYAHGTLLSCQIVEEDCIIYHETLFKSYNTIQYLVISDLILKKSILIFSVALPFLYRMNRHLASRPSGVKFHSGNI